MVDPLSYFLFQPVLHNWCNKGRGMCYPVYVESVVKHFLPSFHHFIYCTGVGNGGGGGQGGHVPPPTLFWLGGGQWYVCAPPPPPLLTPHFYFPLELYVYITLTNNYLTFFIYQLIILWTISINWHKWLLLSNHISKDN